MREIKFRAWDNNNKKYHKVCRLGLNGFSSDLWSQSPISCLSTGGCRSDRYVYEQFTGLCDKNGREIYEGDRCNVLTSDGRITIAHIMFIDGCFELNFISPVVIDGQYHTRDYLKCSVVNHAVEVIGSIHENPEILV